MSKVNELKKMWEQKGQKDKQEAQSNKITTNYHQSVKVPPSTDHGKQSYAEQAKSQIITKQPKPSNTQQNQHESVQIRQLSPVSQKKEDNQANKQAFKSQLEQKLKIGGLMPQQNLSHKRSTKSDQSNENLGERATVEKEEASFKNSKLQLQQFFNRKSQKKEKPEDILRESSDDKIVIPQSEYVYGEDPVQLKKTESEMEPSQQIKETQHAETNLNVRKVKDKPKKSYVGSFDGSDQDD